MRPPPSSLVATTLCFDRAGRRLVTIEGDAIAIVDLARSKTKRIEGARARSLAAFDQQVWIANTANQLVRFDYAGCVIGEPVALEVATSAVLVPAACGSPAAIWSSTPSMSLVEGTSAASSRIGSMRRS